MCAGEQHGWLGGINSVSPNTLVNLTSERERGREKERRDKLIIVGAEKKNEFIYFPSVKAKQEMNLGRCDSLQV